MRLFIAINFDQPVKDILVESIQNLKQHSKSGNFTHRENLHLTLVFIGETTKLDIIKKAMDKVDADKFILDISDFGSFKRNGGDIYWIGVEKNNTLLSIFNQLYKLISDYGFKIDNREYNPHLTFGREVILEDSFNIDEFINSLPKIQTQVKKISLMKSERINGKLTYTEIYKKDLN